MGSRRLLAESIRVDTSIITSSEAAAKAMDQALTADKMNAELYNNNLPTATFLEAPVFEAPKVEASGGATFGDSKDAGSGGGVPLVGIPGLIIVVVILAMAYFVCKRRRAAQEQSAVDESDLELIGMLGIVKSARPAAVDVQVHQVPPYWKNKSGFHSTNFVLELQKLMVESSCCPETTDRDIL